MNVVSKYPGGPLVAHWISLEHVYFVRCVAAVLY